MHSLLDRELIFITGKGGVGKTTMAAAIGIAAAESGRRVIVAEVGDQSRVPAMFGRHGVSAGAEVDLERGLSAITIDPDRALLEWLQSVGGRVSGRLLASSGTFQYFAAAAPGALLGPGSASVRGCARRASRNSRVPKLNFGSRSSGSVSFAILLSLEKNRLGRGRRMSDAAFGVHVPKLRQRLHGKVIDL